MLYVSVVRGVSKWQRHTSLYSCQIILSDLLLYVFLEVDIILQTICNHDHLEWFKEDAEIWVTMIYIEQWIVLV